MKKNLTILLLCMSASGLLLAQGGKLDTTFNHTGIIQTQVGGAKTSYFHVLVQTDERIVAVGLTDDANHTQAVASRFNSDGSTDGSYGENGHYASSNDWPLYQAYDGVLLSYGRLMLFSDVAYQNQIALTRLLYSGVQDSTFGVNGIATINMDFTYYSPVPSRGLLQPDGNFVVIGTYRDFNSGLPRGFAMRVLDDGKIDSTFGNAGIVSFIPPSELSSHSLETLGGKLQPDGKIVISGYVGVTPEECTWYVARLMPDGSFDSGFGTNGVIMPNVGNITWEQGCEVLVQTDGKILVCGDGTKLPGRHFTMIRLKSNGALDTSFGLGGKTQIAFTCCYSTAYDIVQQDDGKIVLGGFSADNSKNHRISLARFKPNGSIDLTFGNAGKVVVDLVDPSDAFGLALQGDGKILVAGRTSNTTNTTIHEGVVLRLVPDAAVGTHAPDQIDAQLSVNPNPVSGGVCNISYNLPEAGPVRLELMNVIGADLEILSASVHQSSGQHTETIRLSDSYPPGEYFLRLVTAKGYQTVYMLKPD